MRVHTHSATPHRQQVAAAIFGKDVKPDRRVRWETVRAPPTVIAEGCHASIVPHGPRQ